MPTSRSYHSYLIESLQDPQEAVAYLDAVLEDSNAEELHLALRNVAEARMTMLHDSQGGQNQEFSFNPLADQRSLSLPDLLKMLDELGFKLSVTLKNRAA